MANVSIPLGEIAPAGNNFLAYLAKIITISQYASLSTDTFLVQLCARWLAKKGKNLLSPQISQLYHLKE